MAKYLTHQQTLELPLHQQALAWEEQRNRLRLQEIKQMAASLALLQPLQAAIKAAGHTLYAGNLSPAYGKRNTIRISVISTSSEISLMKALLTVGLTISERDENGPVLRTATFKKGRLNLEVFTSAENLSRAEQEFAASAALAPARVESEVAA